MALIRPRQRFDPDRIGGYICEVNGVIRKGGNTARNLLERELYGPITSFPFQMKLEATLREIFDNSDAIILKKAKGVTHKPHVGIKNFDLKSSLGKRSYRFVFFSSSDIQSLINDAFINNNLNPQKISSFLGTLTSAQQIGSLSDLFTIT